VNILLLHIILLRQGNTQVNLHFSFSTSRASHFRQFSWPARAKCVSATNIEPAFCIQYTHLPKKETNILAKLRFRGEVMMWENLLYSVKSVIEK